MSYESELSHRLKNIIGLELISTHVGLKEVKADKDKYLQDNWLVTLTYKNNSYDASYSSGIGNRELIRSVKKEGNKYWERYSGMYKTELEACKAQWLKPVPPTKADVMSCLLLDSRCAEGSFENFCDDLGYDSDSRNALSIYLVCQSTRDAMIKLFGQNLFDELCLLEH